MINHATASVRFLMLGCQELLVDGYDACTKLECMGHRVELDTAFALGVVSSTRLSLLVYFLLFCHFL